MISMLLNAALLSTFHSQGNRNYELIYYRRYYYMNQCKVIFYPSFSICPSQVLQTVMQIFSLIFSLIFIYANYIKFFISNFRRVLYVVCFILDNFPASEFYMPTFRNTLFHLHRQVGK
jgi:hypothetical protein